MNCESVFVDSDSDVEFRAEGLLLRRAAIAELRSVTIAVSNAVRIHSVAYAMASMQRVRALESQ